ncbi:hypothetical protein [Viridibacterium curvum]|uniref:hypothetical protein n=1 Tax=Viridibacterium curvum TaxID=1101404 RepID=UPI0031EE8E52
MALFSLFVMSCSENPEFFRSSSVSNLVLIKGLPENIQNSKELIEKYLVDNFSHNKDSTIYVYKYTSRTAYFLDSKEDPGGFSSEEFSRYQDVDGIAVFGFVKCENSQNKNKAIIRYYNDAFGDFYSPGVLINNC